MSYDKERFFEDVAALRKRQPFSEETAVAIVEEVWPKVEEAIDEAVSEGISEFEASQNELYDEDE